MTETTARIRWTEQNDDGLLGHVGTIERPLFMLIPPFLGRWELHSTLSGWDRKFSRGEPDDLKAEAERWLAGFVSSLGAIFPGPGEELVRIEEEPRPAAFFDEHDLAAIEAAADPETSATEAGED